MAKRPNKGFNNRNFNSNKTRIQVKNVRKPANKQNNGIQKKRPLVKTKKIVQDARNKLIQKKRNQVVDARDVLAQIAKKQDARDKLNKIRERRNGNVKVNSINNNNKSNVKIIGNHILQKTDRNGKISLVTNKTKQPSTMNVGIKKQLGLMQAGPKKVVMKRSPIVRQQQQQQQQLQQQTLRQAVLNEIEYARNYDSAMYKWAAKPGNHTTASQLISSLDKNRTSALKHDSYHEWQASPLHKSRLQSQQYFDMDMMEDEEMPLVSPLKQTISLQGPSRNSNIYMRLDNNRIEPETHGILSQTATKTKVVVPAGHRIVVSNLQPTVTQDDVKELFEDIGQLLAARLVRPGIAEVIYKNLKDAQKAVDTYHNRQLDGQPMKCLLVNKRPLNNPTAPPITKMDSHGIMSADPGVSNKLVPDLSTIHKVLFQRK